jgi:hypothetical protein
MRHLKYNVLATLFLGCYLLSPAQNYQALHGSSFAGSLGSGSNPASVVHVPFAWDITPLALQFKQSTNAFKLEKYCFLSAPSGAELTATVGTKPRFVFANQDLRLLNTRVSLNSKTAIAFGATIRSYQYAFAGASNWQDTIFTMADYMKINLEHLPLSGEARGTSWAELYAGFGRTLKDEGDWLINGGLTVKLTRAIAGGYAKALGLTYQYSPVLTTPAYTLTNGNFRYGYSGNFDQLDSNKTSAANRKVFLQAPSIGLGADVGLEYISLAGEETGTDDYAYKTKIGISVLDIGSTRFQHGSRSRLLVAGRPGITDTVIENKFVGVNSFDGFNDSIAGLARSVEELRGDFFIYMPTRLLINLDQHITENFYINAEITLPLYALAGDDVLVIKDMNLFALTPRWEQKNFGVYLPMLLNTKKQVWIGGALKVGPVLFGAHNLANLFSKNSTQSGGMYLALSFRPGKLYDRQAHYPNKLSRRDRRRLECPVF